jgi:transcriptional regulator with XRE-family HTH domain
VKQNTPSNKTQGFSVTLRKLLQHHSLSFRKFAKALGVTHPSLVRLSTSKNANPSVRTLEKLSDFFKISIAELLGEQKIDFKNRPKKLDFDED